MWKINLTWIEFSVVFSKFDLQIIISQKYDISPDKDKNNLDS